jgi:hypothetical protein
LVVVERLDADLTHLVPDAPHQAGLRHARIGSLRRILCQDQPAALFDGNRAGSPVIKRT